MEKTQYSGKSEVSAVTAFSNYVKRRAQQICGRGVIRAASELQPGQKVEDFTRNKLCNRVGSCCVRPHLCRDCLEVS